MAKILKLRGAKPSAAKLLKSLREAVSKAVEKTLKKREGEPHLLRTYRASTHLSKGSNSPFKGERQAFRRRMLNAKIWEPISQILIDERLDQLILAEFKRQDRISADIAQFSLPGFENLPRRVSIRQMNVGQLLLFANKFEKRTRRSVKTCEDLLRLRDLVKDQPLDLLIPEAVARALKGITVERSIPDAKTS